MDNWLTIFNQRPRSWRHKIPKDVLSRINRRLYIGIIEQWQSIQSPSVVKAVLLQGAQVDYEPRNDFSCFNKCIRLGNVQVANIRNWRYSDALVVEAGADVFARPGFIRNTTLLLAVDSQSVESTRYLLYLVKARYPERLQEYVHARNSFQQTALDMAVYKGNLDIVRLVCSVSDLKFGESLGSCHFT